MNKLPKDGDRIKIESIMISNLFNLLVSDFLTAKVHHFCFSSAKTGFYYAIFLPQQHISNSLS